MLSRNRIYLCIDGHFLRSRLRLRCRSRLSVKLHRSRRRNILAEIERIKLGFFNFCFLSFDFLLCDFYFGSFNFRFFGICCVSFRRCDRFRRYVYEGFLFRLLNGFLFVHYRCIHCRSACLFLFYNRRLRSGFYRLLCFCSKRRFSLFFDRFGSIRYFVKRL